jgi:predicted metal-dependent phosphoesterase TrpH
MPTCRADLHVHSWHSGQNANLRFLRSRDCYADPDAIYRTAKARGMDFVTITDHDTIDGCLELLNGRGDLVDFIVGEEISCWLPDSSIEVHFGAWGMTERAHRDVQPLRENAVDVAAYLQEQGIFFALNHLFHFYRGQVALGRYLELIDGCPALETKNGAMLPAQNRLIEEVRRTRAGALAGVGGSDAHTLRRVGCTWTEAAGGTREEFLASLAAGRGVVGGADGGTLSLAADIYGVIAQYWLSLIGLRRHELSWRRRALGIAFSVISAPSEFIPLVVAGRQKARESRWVRHCAAELGELQESGFRDRRSAIGDRRSAVSGLNPERPEP